MHIDLHYPLLSDFKEPCIFRHIFEKYSNIKFNENPSGGSGVVPYGRTDRHEAIFRTHLKTETRIRTRM